jgi:hypothetical protein
MKEGACMSRRLLSINGLLADLLHAPVKDWKFGDFASSLISHERIDKDIEKCSIDLGL